MKFATLIFLTTLSMNAFAQLPVIHSGVYHWDELPVKQRADREGRKILEGTTNEFAYFEMHATTQFKGAKSNAPHTNEDIEEVIIVKEGKLACTIGDQYKELGPGSVLLIPPHVSQAVKNIADGNTSYYVLMFRSKKPMDLERSNAAGGILLLDSNNLEYTEKEGKGAMKYFDRPTAMCENYEMHVTTLTEKGPSHKPHEHIDTEIILITEGEVAMTIDGIDYQGKAGDFFIAESGKLHGVANASDAKCKYFAFKWR